MDASVNYYYSNVANYIRFSTIGVVSQWLSSDSGTGTCKSTRLFTCARIGCEQSGDGYYYMYSLINLTKRLKSIAHCSAVQSPVIPEKTDALTESTDRMEREWIPEGDDVHFWNDMPSNFFFSYLNLYPGLFNTPPEWEPEQFWFETETNQIYSFPRKLSLVPTHWIGHELNKVHEVEMDMFLQCKYPGVWLVLRELEEEV